MIILDKITKPVKSSIMPHPIYIMGHYFYNAGDIEILGNNYSNLEKFLIKNKVKPEIVERAFCMIDEQKDMIGDNQNWYQVRMSKWWGWACVRKLAYIQGRFVDEMTSDPAEIIQELLRKGTNK